MKRKLLFVSCVFCAFLFCAVSNLIQVDRLCAAELSLANNGKTEYTIVISDSATPVEKTAAKELKTYLSEITGTDWLINTEKEVAESAPQILVGSSERAKKLFPGVDFAKVPYDGIIIKTNGKNILLSGHKQRGALYAVNTFLEDFLGVRWWTSTESFVPKKPQLSLNSSKLNVEFAPKLEYRESFYKDAFDPVFATRMKCNGANEPIPADSGDHHRFVYFVHSFYPLIPPEKYFAEHPEWFSEIDGKRTHDHAQLCLTNDEMRKELTKNALEAIRKSPEARFISISQNDWYNPCECEKCKKVLEEEGAESGALIRFVNAVAEDIEKEFPEVWVETLAYQYTRKPPKLAKPRENVVVRLCTIECSFVQPLTGEQNRSLCEDMEGWSKISKQLFVWDYVTNFSSCMLPHPNMNVLAPNIRFFINHGTIGLFEQGDAYCTAGDFVRLRNYVISHLMWNPELKEEELAKEFIWNYYGEKAAPFVAEYLILLHKKAISTGNHIGCFRESTADWLDFDTLSKATEIFNSAIAAAAKEFGDDSVQVKRLVREKLPLDHVWLKQYNEFMQKAEAEKKPFWGPENLKDGWNKFFETCSQNNVQAYREFNTPAQFEDYKARMLKSVSGE
ncbi:MAG: DUF4838 domain-containing protein [Thermoguttaceae bacterium]